MELVEEVGEADDAGGAGVGIEATEGEARGGVEDEHGAGVRTSSEEAAVATEGGGVGDVGERGGKGGGEREGLRGVKRDGSRAGDSKRVGRRRREGDGGDGVDERGSDLGGLERAPIFGFWGGGGVFGGGSGKSRFDGEWLIFCH